MQKPIGLLCDNINWIQPLVRAMEAAGVPSRLIPFPDPPFTTFDAKFYPEIVFNRVAIRTAMGAPGVVTLVRDLLSALQLQGNQVINDRRCHQVGSSKALQSLVFERAGVMSPETLVLHDKAMLSKAREQMPDGMLKANVGGFGAGVWVPDAPDQEVPPSVVDAAFEADGMAVWQKRYTPRDNVIYRVELLGGNVLYRARVPVEPDSFNNCLGRVCSLTGPGTPGEAVTLDQVQDTQLSSALTRICKLAGMDVGSVEYLIPREESAACFFDINPVSTHHPQAKALLGFDPYEKLALWLKDLIRKPAPGVLAQLKVKSD